MLNREREVAVGMVLARRMHLYSLMHLAFGSRPTAESVGKMLSVEAGASFGFVNELLASDGCEDIARRTVGSCGSTITACVDEAIACIERGERGLEDPARARELVGNLRSDYDKLFQVPGRLYVHPWESPYTSEDSMVFRESTLDVRSFYHDAGFKLQVEKRFPDDHIAAMMDYMGRMGHRAYEAFADGRDDEALRTLAVQRCFADRHILTWVDRFADKVMGNDARGCYGAFAGGMAAFAFLDAALVDRLEKELVAR